MPRRPTAEVTTAEAETATTEPQEVVEEVMEEIPPVVEPQVPVRTFDPTKHLTKVSGRQYLEVKWRLVWFRDVHPDGVIETELIQATDNGAIFRAKVSAPGAGSATGFGSETRGDFGDFLEKAETKAIGRALGAMGFGTQFSEDFDFGAEKGRVVDSPVGGRGSTSFQPSSTPARPKITAEMYPAPNAGGDYVCEECGEIIQNTTRNDGSPYPAGEKAFQTMNLFNKVLCGQHAREAKQAAAQG